MEMTMKVTVYQRATIRPPQVALFLPDDGETPECIVKAESELLATVTLEWQPSTTEVFQPYVVTVKDETFDLAKSILLNGRESTALAEVDDRTCWAVEEIIAYQGLRHAVEAILTGNLDLDI